MCSRMLYTILPSPYSDENLNDVLEDLSSDLLSLYRDGIKVSHILVLVRLQLFSPQEKFQYSFMSVIWGGNSTLVPTSKVQYKEQEYFYRFVVIGVKGDWPYLRQCMGLCRGYNCLQKCHRCQVPETSLRN